MYLTESDYVARKYCDLHRSSNKKCLFLNEVVNSKAMQTKTLGSFRNPEDRTKPNIFTKNTFADRPQPPEDDYVCDDEGRVYRKNNCSKVDEYVADAKFVKPRYLFVLITEKC